MIDYEFGLEFFFADITFFSMFASSNKPKFPGETFHQTYPTAVKGHYGGFYPVLSDHSGQLFFDISAAASEMIIVKPLEL